MVTPRRHSSHPREGTGRPMLELDMIVANPLIDEMTHQLRMNLGSCWGWGWGCMGLGAWWWWFLSFSINVNNQNQPAGIAFGWLYWLVSPPHFWMVIYIYYIYKYINILFIYIYTYYIYTHYIYKYYIYIYVCIYICMMQPSQVPPLSPMGMGIQELCSPPPPVGGQGG